MCHKRQHFLEHSDSSDPLKICKMTKGFEADGNHPPNLCSSLQCFLTWHVLADLKWVILPCHRLIVIVPQGLPQKGIFFGFLIQNRFQKEFREYQECMHSHETATMFREGVSLGKTSKHCQSGAMSKNIYLEPKIFISILQFLKIVQFPHRLARLNLIMAVLSSSPKITQNKINRILFLSPTPYSRTC